MGFSFRCDDLLFRRLVALLKISEFAEMNMPLDATPRADLWGWACFPHLPALLLGLQFRRLLQAEPLGSVTDWQSDLPKIVGQKWTR